MPTTTPQFDRITRVKIAAAATVDERTVKNYLTGRRTFPAQTSAIQSALRALGIRDPRASQP